MSALICIIMSVIIKNVKKFSSCSLHGLKAGDVLLSVNGNEIFDVLDYDYYCSEDVLELQYQHKDKIKTAKIHNSDNNGLEFETYLMDKKQCCKNKCVFCFVDQMPSGMRESLYFKDDDSRLSFLFGNYITLTGISEREVQRIIDMHICPINISVHTMNPPLRVEMMKNPNAGKSLDIIRRFAEGNIKMNTQLVLCPGINDGDELDFSLRELYKYHPSVQSIAVVPVGLTKFREGLPPLRLFTPDEAKQTIEIVDKFNFECAHIAYCADELYLNAGLPVPEAEYYDGYVQLENGVGMWRCFLDEFNQALQNGNTSCPGHPIHIATGVAAYPLMKQCADLFMAKNPDADITVHEIQNDFFGHSVTVAGLLTAKDIITQLDGKITGELVICETMLKTKDEPIFLDDIHYLDLGRRLGITVTVTDGSGENLVNIFSGQHNETE